MATRFYLESTGSVPLASLARHTGWLTASGPTSRFPMNTTKAGSTLTNTATVTGGASKEICVIQFQYGPIGANTFNNTDTFNGIHRCLESLATGNCFVSSILYVVQSDGSTIRGTIYDDSVGNSDVEMATSAATRVTPSNAFVTKSTVSAQNGDYLIFEVGVAVNGTGVSSTATQRFGSSAGSDFALTTGLTTDLNPWLEWSGTLAAYTSSNTNQLMMMGAGT